MIPFDFDEAVPLPLDDPPGSPRRSRAKRPEQPAASPERVPQAARRAHGVVGGSTFDSSPGLRGPNDMAVRLTEIQSIDAAAAALLASVGVTTTAHLLDRCAGADERARVCADTGLSERAVRRWVGLADLLRLAGMTPRFAELLAAVGAGTIQALRGRQPDRLADAMLAVQAEKRSTRLVPSASVLSAWISQAGELEPVLLDDDG